MSKKIATYSAVVGRVMTGKCALLDGVRHPMFDEVNVNVRTGIVVSHDESTGVIETEATRYVKATPPALAYKPAHGGYPGVVR